jgi:DNA-binding transcriptional ArsR family regulator
LPPFLVERLCFSTCSLSALQLGLGGDTPPKQSASGSEASSPLSGREMLLAPAVHPTRYLGKTKSYRNTEISESERFHGKMSESECEFTSTHLSTALDTRSRKALISKKTNTETPPPQLREEAVFVDLGALLASSCRRKILKVLWKTGIINVMSLVRKVNSTYSQVNQHLQILQKEDIIFDKHYGRARLIRLNKENPKTPLLLQALKILETPTNNK